MKEEKKEELKAESMQEEIEEMRQKIYKMWEVLLPPKEVRREFMRNLYMAELSILKAIRTLLDYKISTLEKRAEGKEEKKTKSKKIEVE